MLVYIGVMLILLVLAFLENKKIILDNHYCLTNKSIISWCSLSVILLMAIFRSKNVGCDLENYEISFQYLRSLNFLELCARKKSLLGFNVFNWGDFGFDVFNWGIGKIFDSIYALMVIEAFIVLVVFFIVLRKYSSNISFSFFLFMCFGQLTYLFSGLRQELAIAIVLFSITYVEQKRWKEFMACCILAASFHVTALIWVVVYWFGYKAYDRALFLKYILWGIGISCATFIGIPFIASLYIRNDYSQAIISGRGIKLFLLRCMILYICMILLKSYKKHSRGDWLFLRIYSVGCIVQILAMGFSVLTRLTDYFCVGIIVLLPNVINGVGNRIIKYVLFAMTILGGVLYFGFYIKNNSSGIIPYEFFWQAF